MSSKGERFVASIFGIRLSEDVPQLQSLVPKRISNQIMTGQLPKFNPSTIMLGRMKHVILLDKAALVIKQKGAFICNTSFRNVVIK